MRAVPAAFALAALLLSSPCAAEEEGGEATVAAHLGVRLPFTGDGGYGDNLAAYGYGGLTPALVLAGEGGYRVTAALEVGGSLSYLYATVGGPHWRTADGDIAHHGLEPVGFARVVYRDDLLFGASVELGPQLLLAVADGDVDPAGSLVIRPSILFGSEYLDFRIGYAAPVPQGFDHPSLGGFYVLLGLGGVP